MIPLDDLALFVAVGKALNFAKAAEVTGTPAPTLSRKIKQLEKTIGTPLFNRTTRKVSFTEAGLTYFSRCQPIIDKAIKVNHQISQQFTQPKGVLKASLPVDFAVSYVANLLPEFCVTYPDITFDFDLSPKKHDALKGYYDVAIRTGKLADSNLISRSLGNLHCYLYTSPKYLKSRGEPKSIDALVQHECFSLSSSHWHLYQAGQKQKVPIYSKFKLNNFGMIKNLVVLGMGIALVPEILVREEEKSGALVKILWPWQGIKIPVYAITESRLLPSKTKVFIDYLTHKMKLSKTDQSNDSPELNLNHPNH